MAYLKMYGSTTIIPQYKTMTVILDLNNPDPTTWATYADDAIGMTAGSDAWDTFFGHYPCIVDNGVELGKLKRSNFAQYEDGTSAPITTLGKDVMICFPRKGIKIEYTDSSHLSVSMTDEDNKDGYSYLGHSYKGNACDRFYLGAYKGFGSGSKLYSTSGQTPTVSQKFGTMRTWAQSRGIGYEQSAFFQALYRQAMYCLKYKAQDSQIAVGRGYVDGNSTIATTGNTNTKGMDWGESTGKVQCKLFGIEDHWGNVYEFLDGVFSNSERKIYVADGNYNNSASGYTDAGTTAPGVQISGKLKIPYGTNLAGFIQKNTDYGSDTTYFCDSSYRDTNNLGEYGGYYASGNSAGVFNLSMSRNATGTWNIYGSRLMYMHVA